MGVLPPESWTPLSESFASVQKTEEDNGEVRLEEHLLLLPIFMASFQLYIAT